MLHIIVLYGTGHWSVLTTTFWIGSFFSSHMQFQSIYFSTQSFFTEVLLELLSYLTGSCTSPLISATCSRCR